MATRLRRGKTVEIPEQWLHNITTRTTIKERNDARILARASRKRRLRADRKFDLENQLLH